MEGLIIRTIKQDDNPVLAKIIRDSLAEFKANKPGTVYFDDRTDHLFEEFKVARSIYYVAAYDSKIIGGAGVYPTENLPAGTCELVKLYLSPDVRGKGIGKLLLEKCIAAARELGYSKMYLETMPELTVAIPMYEKSGFTYLQESQGCSGHTGCDIWMIKDLAL
ncbi:MAG: GNAT family N-acetyltransferase [Chitinophagaceae bacterium]|nr:GNAT family N-acetyltransferase [Chitinophagaceae bacterium]